MSLRVRRILVAIRDGHGAPRSELRKAAALARAVGADIELFYPIAEPLAIHSIRYATTGQSGKQTMETVRQRSQQRLERLARSSLFKNLSVRAQSNWDYPAHEAIVRRAQAIRAELVVSATRPQPLGVRRLLLTNTDWELIRHCPCPLLLVRSSRDYRKPTVIAAVDPFHANAKPAGLDDRILEAAASLARVLHGETHLFHSFMPLTIMAPIALGPPAVAVAPESEDVRTAQVARVFESLAKKAGIPPRRRHLRMGDVRTQLAAVAKRTRAAIVVMGAISRSGLRRVFIGNTAETVLDSLPCDVFVVKPAQFKTAVSRRRTHSSR